MQLRKNRVLNCGASNTDFRSQPYTRPDFLSRIDFISTTKVRNFQEILKGKMEKSPPNPFSSTEQLYKENAKTTKHKIQISNFRPPIEETEKMKFFTGEQKLPHIDFDNLHIKDSKNEDEETLRKNIKKSKIQEKRAQNKHEKNSKAIQETQLVGIENNKETLEGKVDLNKVREIRRAIRRRYANRKNFQKIFQAWDMDGTGSISAKNAYDMIKQLGINLNIDEARVLIASADANQGNSINMDEFIQLIFNDNETLNVDLKNILSLGKEDLERIMQSNELSNKLQQNKIIQKERQVNQILKNKITNLTTFLKSEDIGNRNFVNFERFEKVIRKAGINETHINQQDIKTIFDNYKLDDYKFEYIKFLKELSEFQFKADDIYQQEKQQMQKSKEKENNSYQSKFLAMYEKQNEFNGELNLYELSKIDGYHLEKIRSHTTKINYTLQRYFPTKKDFDDFFMNHLSIDDKEKYTKSYISKDNLASFLKNIMLNFGETTIKNSELESFLSSVQYNKGQYAKVDSISNTIYEIDERQWDNLMQQKLNNPPPPNNECFHEYYPQGTQTLKKGQTITQSEANLKENNRYFSQTQNDENTSLDGQNTKQWYSKKSQTKQNPQLYKILQKFDDKVFCGTKNAYDVYKMFDVDQDGYISQKDFVNKLQEINVLNKEEIPVIMDYLDPTQKGYVNFQEFSGKIRVGCADNDEFGKQKFTPFIYPDKVLVDDMKSTLPHLLQNKHRVQKSLELEEDFENKAFVPQTRFGASPAFKNTFLNFQAPKESGMFQSDQLRYNKEHNHKLQYLVEEQTFQKMRSDARISTKKQWNETIKERVENVFKTLNQKDEEKIRAKGLKKWSYEHRCQLKNNWQ